MRFGIRRLDAGGDNGRRYHLFDEDGRVELVADYGSRWLAAEPGHHVRFARSSGDVVASMRLPRPLLPGHNRQRSVSYAVILNHAVYAIINEYHTLFLHENVQTEAVSIHFEHFDANRGHFYSNFEP